MLIEQNLSGQQLRTLGGHAIYELGDFIAAGGEGSVYALNGEPGFVAKLYPNPMDRDAIKRLSATIDAATPDIKSIAAWPEDVLVSRQRTAMGFIMPRVENGIALHQIITPDSRMKERPNFTYASLLGVAENLARAVATLHRDHVIIGDINGQNFLILKNGNVRVIDCDSMQVGEKPKWYPAVKVEDYLAPELHGKHLSQTPRTPSHDVFALAVLFFQLLIMGRHPFAGNQGLDLDESIIQHTHAFLNHPPKYNAFKILDIAPTSILTPRLIELFTQTFDRMEGSMWRKGNDRPSAEAWVQALSEARTGLRICGSNPAHQFTAQANSCPWCDMERRGISPLFVKRAPIQPRAATNNTSKTSFQIWKPNFSVSSIAAKLLSGGVKFLGKVIYVLLASLIELIAPILYKLIDGMAEIYNSIELFVENLFLWIIRWTIWIVILSVKFVSISCLVLLVLEFLGSGL